MYKKEVLQNGVRIVTEEIPYVRSVSIGLWVGAGSRDEDSSNSGIAHFIEHMMFKGTERRSAKDIAETLDAIGGQLNAFTSKEYTCYYAKVLDEHFDTAVDILTDMFFNSSFREEDIEKEKNVVIEEIKMYEDTPDELVHDIFAGALWKDHPLGRAVIGSEEVIKNLRRRDIINFINKFYTPDSIVISVVGNIKHEAAVAKLAPIFETAESRKSLSNYTVPETYSKILLRQKDTEQVHLCIGTPGLPLDNQKIYVLHVLNSVMGGGISSRLFQEIRENNGLAYSVFTYHSSYHNAGLFTVYAGLSLPNLAKVLSLITQQMQSFRTEGITLEELKRAKEQLKGSMFLGLENITNRMTRLGKSELSLNRVITVEEAVEKINHVTLDDVKQLAEELFQEDKIVVSSIGPQINENVFKERLWNR